MRRRCPSLTQVELSHTGGGRPDGGEVGVEMRIQVRMAVRVEVSGGGEDRCEDRWRAKVSVHYCLTRGTVLQIHSTYSAIHYLMKKRKANMKDFLPTLHKSRIRNGRNTHQDATKQLL